MKTSIVILTCNQFDMTRNCLESIAKNTPEAHEVIVVDNGSTDETLSYLEGLGDRITLIVNDRNLGFARGCNQGTEAATGDAVLYLNNDTVLPPGWLAPMLRVLWSEEDIGMAGPVTNYASGHQKIPVPYTRIEDMEAYALHHRSVHAGSVTEVRRLIGFCLLVKRSVLDEIGGFDERFGFGNYEDDDLCLRAIRSGYRLMLVHEAFIHHIGHASMGQMNSAALDALLAENADKARRKWGATIYDLIYAQKVSVGVCIAVYPHHEAGRLRGTLESLAGLADEIAVLDLGSRDGAGETASAFTPAVRVIQGNPAAFPLDEMMEALTVSPYLLMLKPGDILTPGQRRRLSGLKLALHAGYDAVLLHAADGPRFLVRRGAGALGQGTPANPERPPLFLYDSGLAIGREEGERTEEA